MSLGRAWFGQLGRASGAAVLAPAALIAALGALSLAGGFGGLGSIGQTISGPGPPAAAHGGGLPRSERATARLVALAAPGPRTSAAVTAGVGQGAVTTGDSRTTRGPQGVTPPRRPQSGQAPPPAHGAPPAPGAPAPRPNPPAPAPPPTKAPVPSTIDHVVSTAGAVTQKLPSPVGPAATHAVDQLGKTIDGIIGAPPRVTL